MDPHTSSQGGVLDDLTRSAQSVGPRDDVAVDVWSAEGDVLRDLLGGY